jgi:bifunctional oligoribonuclease and PAP phosphatase NrnA
MENRMETTENRLRKLGALIQGCQRILVLTHQNPDGDALGSLLAMGEGLKQLNKQTVMYVEGGVPGVFLFLPGALDVAAEPGEPDDYDLVMLLDCHDLDRVGPTVSGMKRAEKIAVLDHHVMTGPVGDHFVVDTDYSAAGELVRHLMNILNITITPSMAMNLFTAISTDTGSFSFSNTTARTLETAASLVRLGASPWHIFSELYLKRSRGQLALLQLALKGMEFYHEGRLGVMTITREMLASTGTGSHDTDGFIEYPRSVAGTELAVLFKENGDGRCKVSLRSMGRANAEAVARMFGGGGHFQAAGFTLQASLLEARERVLQAVGDMLGNDLEEIGH